MKSDLSIMGGQVPLWYKCMKRTVPFSMGLFMLMASTGIAYAASPTISPEANEITQQRGVVSGKVTDTNGEALVGVTIVVKGTKTTATTDVNGRYSIKANPGQTLRIAYIGYEKVEKRVNGSIMDVQLKSIDNTLNEAVVIGYGTVKKADLAGSVAVMDSKQFKD